MEESCHYKLVFTTTFIFCIFIFICGCKSNKQTDRVISMGTTTSVYDSGLLDYLRPIIKQEIGIDFEVVARGSGQVLAMGENGDFDLLITHDPNREEQAVLSGAFEERIPFMYNFFIVVGFKNDKAGVSTSTNIGEAMNKILESKIPFISRGDASGTHAKELLLWKDAEIDITNVIATNNFYIQIGRGMGDALIMTDEMDGYTLSDKSTFLYMQKNIQNLSILFEQAPELKNTYSLMILSENKFPDAKHSLSKELTRWLLSDVGQNYIASYSIENTQLFFVD